MRLAVLTASTCGTMIVITLANLIAVPAIQMGCPENMTGKVMSLALSEHVRPAPRTDRIRLGVQRLPGGRGPGGDVRPGHRDAAASRARNAAVLGRDSITFALDS